MPYATIRFEVEDRIALITLSRPEAMNAINEVLNRETVEALMEVERSPEVDVVILTGAGRAFCAGLDLKELAQKRDFRALAFSMISAIRLLDRPTIAAVNGPAITGGFELALACDIILASPAAVFADTHARLGVLPGAGLSQILPRLVGMKKAKELSFTGNFMSAEEALSFGLVNRIVPAESLLQAARNLARDILGANQATVRQMKRLIDQGEGLTLEAALRMEYEEHRRNLPPAGLAAAADLREEVMARGRDQVRSSD